MKFTLALSLIAGASAFAPASQKAPASALFDSPYANSMGVVAPTGKTISFHCHVILIASFFRSFDSSFSFAMAC